MTTRNNTNHHLTAALVKPLTGANKVGPEMNLKGPAYHELKSQQSEAAFRFHSLFDYTDYSCQPVYDNSEDDPATKQGTRNGNQFPDKLFQMLQDVAAIGQEDIGKKGAAS
jgi:hypothetical protein